MKKIALMIGCLCAMSLGMAQGANPKKIECPVMKGHMVDIAKATKEKMFADYKGRRYFFCCAGCPDAFKKNPAKFAKTGKSIPTPKGAPAAPTAPAKPEHDHGSAPKMIACAVMPDHKVDIAKATKDKMYADHEGRRYFFCCAGCPAAFKNDPAKYSKAASIPTPK